MWSAAVETQALRAATAAATTYRQRMLRMFGIPESEIALTLREAESAGIDLGELEVTTCLKRGEVEVVTRYEPAAEATYEAFERVIRERHADTLFSDDGSTVDDQVASMLRADGLTLGVAESCTGGLLAARITELAGSSDYFKGAIVAYANEVKVAVAAVPAALSEITGSRSPWVTATSGKPRLRASGSCSMR